MIIHESEEIVPANLDEVKQVHSVTADASQHIGHTMAKTLVVTHDKASRIQMLERLIVEIVHEAVPQECEYTDVSYRVSLELALLRDHSSGWYRGGD